MGGWLYEHENITNSASNSVEVGAGAELGKMCYAMRDLNPISHGVFDHVIFMGGGS